MRAWLNWLTRLWNVRPRHPMVGLALAAIAGILAADGFTVNPGTALFAAIAGAFLLIFRRSTLTCWLFAFLTFLAIHTVRHLGNPGRLIAASLHQQPVAAHAVGIVINEPETAPRGTHTRCLVKLESLALSGQPVQPAGARVEILWAAASPSYGDRIELTGAFENLEPARNPGQFDYRAYMERAGVYSIIRSANATQCRILDHDQGNAIYALAIRSREWIKHQLEFDMEASPEIAALVQSMVLGLRNESSAETRELFRRTGIMHLFAVSGLNIAMLISLLWFLLRPLRVSRRASVWITMPVLIFYATITGLSASSVRATVMGLVILAGYLLDRRPLLINSLSTAAFAILAWDTNQLFSVGFQCSFLLVCAIVAGSGYFQRRLEPLLMPDAFLPTMFWSPYQKAWAVLWKNIAAAIGVTMSAWLGSLAFSAGYFNLFSIAALPCNLAAVPLAFAILALGLMSVLSGLISPALAALFNNANWAVAKLLLLVVDTCARLPGGTFYVEVPPSVSPPVSHITVLDLGQGAGIHLRTGSSNWLIDCGGERLFARIIQPYLQHRGVNGLDALVLTHGDSQHIGAALRLYQSYAPKQVVDSVLADRSAVRRKLHRQLAADRHPKTISQRGDSLEIAPGVVADVLYPVAGLHRSVADDKTIVLRLSCGPWRILFMSDSGFATEQWLIENEPDLRADILIKGQHAKDLSGTPDFLARVNPQVVICEAPAQYRFRSGNTHQFEAWSQSLASRGIPLFRQDQTGAVEVKLSDQTADVTAFLTHQSIKLHPR